MKKWSQLLIEKCKDYFVYKMGQKIFDFFSYNGCPEPAIKEMEILLAEEYKIKRKGRTFCISDLNVSDSKKFLLRPKTSDTKVFKQVFIDKEYFPIINIIKDNNGNVPIKRIVDAGSNIGLTSLYFNNYFPAALIISIEPDIENYAHQKKNIKLNHLKKSVKVIRGALWKNNTDNLSVSNNFRDGQSWSKSVVPGKSMDDNYVNPLTLREILYMFGDKVLIDILKMDIEGSEAELFKNNDFIKVLKTSVKYLCLEIHDEVSIRKDIYNIFSKIDFSFEEHGETCFCINYKFK